MALRDRLHFLVKLEFKNLGFRGKGKTEVPGEKVENQQQTQTPMASTPEFEPGPHGREASALTIAPPLLDR